MQKLNERLEQINKDGNQKGPLSAEAKPAPRLT
jgi:hypothetical protein